MGLSKPCSFLSSSASVPAVQSQMMCSSMAHQHGHDASVWWYDCTPFISCQYPLWWLMSTVNIQPSQSGNLGGIMHGQTQGVYLKSSRQTFAAWPAAETCAATGGEKTVSCGRSQRAHILMLLTCA